MSNVTDFPKEIEEAINNGSLAVFVGAGVSRIAGLPSWNNLARELINECYKLGVWTYAEKELILQKVNDNKQLITIAYAVLQKQGKEAVFFELLKKNLTLEKKVSNAGVRIFEFLKDTTALVLTTNADLLLHSQYEETRIYSDINRVTEWSSDRGCLIHLHGEITNKDSLVFTTTQYLKRYSNSDFREYLKLIFNSKTVLFIGYGLAEFELLDFIVQKADSHRTHFILTPCFSYEEVATNAMELYYKELGIEQKPYCIDKTG